MGLLWWKTNKSNPAEKKPDPKAAGPESGRSAPGMNGAMEVGPRKKATGVEAEVSVFEFGSVSSSTDKVTVAGYCPISDDLEPCRWEIIPAQESDAPQFRVVF